MVKPIDPAKKVKMLAEKEKRLKEALRANLQRRKSQKRIRADDPNKNLNDEA
jgi:hypothetical protein